MIKTHPSRKQELSFTIRLEIEELCDQPDSLLLRCELLPAGINAQFAVPLFLAHTPYNELASEKVQFRLTYIHKRLDDALKEVVMTLWNDSGSETEKQLWAIKEFVKRKRKNEPNILDEDDKRDMEKLSLKEWRKRNKVAVLGDEGYQPPPSSHGGARRGAGRPRKRNV